MKKIWMFTWGCLIGGVLITGCGDSSSSNSSTTGSSNSQSSISTSGSNSSNSSLSSVGNSSNTITVVDNYIIGATVRDNGGHVFGDTNGSGQVSANDYAIVYPLFSVGGFIDVNMNGQRDDEDIAVPGYIEFLTNQGYVISPLTTLITKGADPQKLAEAAGVNVQDFYQDPIATNDVMLEKLNQIAYILLAAKREQTFIYSVNNIGGGDLPSFGGGTAENTQEGSLETFANLAYKAIGNNQTAMDAINRVVNANVEKATEIENVVKPLKVLIVPNPVGGGNGNGNNSGSGNGGVMGSVSSTINSAASSVSSFVSSLQSSTGAGTGALPNLNDHSDILQPVSSTPSDLPNVGNASTVTSSSSSSVSSTSSNVSSNVGSGQDVPSFSYN